MTRIQYENLKVGDMCVINKGHDEGKKVEVVYIEDKIDECESILVRAVNCELSQITHNNKWLRLTDWRQLNIV